MTKHLKPCMECNKDFEYKVPDCCSTICANRKIAKNNRFWDVVTEEQRLERLKEIFEKHVVRYEDLDECWDWNGSIKKHGGYPLMNTPMANTAHRASWIIHNGPIPNDLHVLHNCPVKDNARCTNPRHLKIGTHRENMLDHFKKGAHKKSHKLDIPKVKEIKKLLKEGIVHQRIAEQFNVSRELISDIYKNRRWKRVTLDDHE